MSDNTPIISFRNADILNGEATVIYGLNMDVYPGDFVYIVGKVGTGKTSIIRTIIAENSLEKGEGEACGFSLNGISQKEIPFLRRKMGVVFQDFRLLKDRNVYENVAFAQRIVQTPSREIKKNVPAILSIVGLAGKYKAKPKQLSGGEQQRVAMARALINKPPILLCDEPTGNLDPKNSWEIMKLLEQINKRGTTVIVVTHNREIVNEMQKRVVTLKKGVVISDEEKGGYIDEN